MAKIIVAKKAEDKDKGKKYCLNCGIDISHRAVSKFCCPACKAIYKENQKLNAEEAKKTKKKKPDYATHPMHQKEYSDNRVERFNQKYGKTN